MKRYGWIVALVIVAVAIGVFVVLRGGAGGTKESRSVSFALSKNIWSAVAIVAEDQGFFREESLDVDFNYVQAAKFSMDALVAGSTDLAGGC